MNKVHLGKIIIDLMGKYCKTCKSNGQSECKENKLKEMIEINYKRGYKKEQIEQIMKKFCHKPKEQD